MDWQVFNLQARSRMKVLAKNHCLLNLLIIFLKKNTLFKYILFFIIRNLLSIRYFLNKYFTLLIKRKFYEIEKYLKKSLKEYVRSDFYIQYKLKTRHKYLELYKIPGTINFDPNPIYNTPNTYSRFQIDLKKFQKNLVKYVEQKISYSFYRFGDGEYFFLKKIPLGSATPGRRALSKSFDEIDNDIFLNGVLKNDFISGLLYPQNRIKFKELYPGREIDFPSEYIYGLIANKWFIRTFKERIGLIGAKEKLQLIERLLEFKRYRKYLGIDMFCDYIYVKQRFAADDVESLEKYIGEQLKNSKSDIFLVGIGHVKSAVLYRFKKYKKAVYIDVGSGIDAIAGLINVNKPFLGAWTNFRIKNYDYSIIDDLRYNGWGRHVILE
jgi:hypothetical protein